MVGWLSSIPTPHVEPERKPWNVLDVVIDLDGTGHLFCARAVDAKGDERYIIEELLAGLTTRFLYMVGELYHRAAYLAPVDAGVLVTNLMGARSIKARGWESDAFRKYDRKEYRRTTRAAAPTLRDDHIGVARQLVLPLARSTTQGAFDPFVP